MYFPIGWSKTLKIRLESNEHLAANAGQENADDELNRHERLLSIKTSSDKSLLCVLTNFSLRIWFCKVRLSACAYRAGPFSALSRSYLNPNRSESNCLLDKLELHFSA